MKKVATDIAWVVFFILVLRKGFLQIPGAQ